MRKIRGEKLVATLEETASRFYDIGAC
jgi:hypothetical protein